MGLAGWLVRLLLSFFSVFGYFLCWASVNRLSVVKVLVLVLVLVEETVQLFCYVLELQLDGSVQRLGQPRETTEKVHQRIFNL